MSFVMFGARRALLLLPVALPSTRPARTISARGPSALPFSPPCSARSHGLLHAPARSSIMNVWQPHIEATHAGLIYCAEPVFTALLCLFLPALLSVWAGIAYPE